MDHGSGTMEPWIMDQKARIMDRETGLEKIRVMLLDAGGSAWAVNTYVSEARKYLPDHEITNLANGEAVKDYKVWLEEEIIEPGDDSPRYADPW